MIWSVSMLVAGRTAVRERMVVIGSIWGCWPVVGRSVQEFARVRDASAHCGRCGGRGARKHRARPRALPAFEVTVAGADAELSGVDRVAVHAEAHRTTGLAPLGTGVDEDLREPARLRFALDLL